MDIGTILVKYCLCLFNFVFVVCGIAVTALGAWLAADQNSLLSLLKMADADTIKETGSTSVLMEQIGFFLIALGAFIFIISFLGCCGALKESRVLLGLYSFFLVVIFALEIACVVLFVVYRPQLENDARQGLTASVSKLYTTPERQNPFTAAFNAYMAKGECCGVSNFTDFKRAEMFQANKTFGQQIPVACCKLQPPVWDFKPIDSQCIFQPNPQNSNLNTGCLDSLMYRGSQNLIVAIIVGLVVALLQIIGIIFAICVYKAAYYDYK